MLLKNHDRFFYRLKKRDSKKLRWSRCVKAISISETGAIRKKDPVQLEYQNLCKSAKCSLHREGSMLSKTPKERVLHLAVFKKIATARLCRVREFEEHEKHQNEINIRTFRSVESLMERVTKEDIKFEKYLGKSLVKNAITRLVIWPIIKPRVFKGLRAAPTGVLLFGPNGVGKTTIGKNVAYETRSSFFNLSGSVFTSEEVDKPDNFLKVLFLLAKARQPSVILMDELDSFLSKRMVTHFAFNRKIKKALLSCMDSVDRNPDDRILVIGTTRRPADLDEDIMLRFSYKFYISLPDKEARRKLLEFLLEGECHSLDYLYIDRLAGKTEGYTVGEIKKISQTAAMSPMSAVHADDFKKLELAAVKPISSEDFLFALQMIKPSFTKEELLPYEYWDTDYGFGGQTARKL